VIGFDHKILSGLRPRLYLSVADPSLRASCPHATLVRSCTSRQVTFFVLCMDARMSRAQGCAGATAAKKKSPKAPGPNAYPERAGICASLHIRRTPEWRSFPALRGFGSRRCPDAASLPRGSGKDFLSLPLFRALAQSLVLGRSPNAAKHMDVRERPVLGSAIRDFKIHLVKPSARMQPKCRPEGASEGPRACAVATGWRVCAPSEANVARGNRRSRCRPRGVLLMCRDARIPARAGCALGPGALVTFFARAKKVTLGGRSRTSMCSAAFAHPAQHGREHPAFKQMPPVGRLNLCTGM
jgi:hypothetical protein